MQVNESKLFNSSVLNHEILLTADMLTNNIDNTILSILKREVGDRCGKYGFIKNDSIEILERSIGKLNTSHLNGSVSYNISYRADICNPIEGQIISCQVKKKNKMGILAEATPLIIVLASQYHKNNMLDKLQENDDIKVIIIAKRFELYSDKINVIGKLL